MAVWPSFLLAKYCNFLWVPTYIDFLQKCLLSVNFTDIVHKKDLTPIQLLKGCKVGTYSLFSSNISIKCQKLILVWIWSRLCVKQVLIWFGPPLIPLWVQNRSYLAISSLQYEFCWIWVDIRFHPIWRHITLWESKIVFPNIRKKISRIIFYLVILQNRDVQKVGQKFWTSLL